MEAIFGQSAPSYLTVKMCATDLKCGKQLTVEIRTDSLVPWEQLKINNTFEIPPNTQHNLLLMNIDF